MGAISSSAAACGGRAILVSTIGSGSGLVAALMAARRAVRDAAGEPAATASARAAVEAAKVALGERGPVWWDDGAPDYNRHMAKTTPYAAWFAGLNGTAHEDSD